MLSSRWTLFAKYVIGPIWIILFGYIVLTLFNNAVNPPPPPGFQWIFVGAWIVGSVGVLRFTFPLKRVELRDGRLHVSNYIRDWVVLPADIESVKQNRWINSRPIRVRLRHEIEGLGSGFVFIPPARPRFRFWREDPQVDTLRRFAETVSWVEGRK